MVLSDHQSEIEYYVWLYIPCKKSNIHVDRQVLLLTILGLELGANPVQENLVPPFINISCSNLLVAHRDQPLTHLFVSSKSSSNAPILFNQNGSVYGHLSGHRNADCVIINIKSYATVYCENTADRFWAKKQVSVFSWYTAAFDSVLMIAWSALLRLLRRAYTAVFEAVSFVLDTWDLHYGRL